MKTIPKGQDRLNRSALSFVRHISSILSGLSTSTAEGGAFPEVGTRMKMKTKAGARSLLKAALSGESSQLSRHFWLLAAASRELYFSLSPNSFSFCLFG